MKAVIGVTPLVNPRRDTWYVDRGYMEGIARAGGVPLVLPLAESAGDTRAAAALCDGFLFTGGHDIAPELYGEEPDPRCGEWVPVRDAAEEVLLKAALREGKPVLGICRGIQLMNAVLSGSLWQDLPGQRPGSLDHSQDPPYDRPVHDVTLTEGAPLRALLGKERLAVNSLHHQAVKELSPWLRPMALAEDGVVEAAYMPSRPFVWALQWHPEFLLDRDEGESLAIFRAFVAACGGKAG